MVPDILAGGVVAEHCPLVIPTNHYALDRDVVVKPFAAICHGPWTLVEAGMVKGKTLTSRPRLQIDVGNAGEKWRDCEVFVCPTQGFDLLTSRKPDDPDAFGKALVTTFARVR